MSQLQETTVEQQGIKQWLVLLGKGMLMGVCEAVPGISGGTMALITGIYGRFIKALSSFTPDLIGLLFKGEFKIIAQRIDLGFLIAVLLGSVISIFSLSNVIHYALEFHLTMLMAFFCGLIFVSGVYLLKEHATKSVQGWISFVSGVALAVILANFINASLEPTPLILFVCGAIAISAMILPGLSGSMLLILLGVYEGVILLVKSFDIIALLPFAIGCGVGLITFSHLINWLLNNYKQQTLMLMIGFIFGALVKVWPWQLEGQWLTPMAFHAINDQGHMIFELMLAIFGGLIVAFTFWASNKALSKN